MQNKNIYRGTDPDKGYVSNRLTGFVLAATMATFAVPIGSTCAKAQNTVVTGSVPSGPANDEVLPLTLRTALYR